MSCFFHISRVTYLFKKTAVGWYDNSVLLVDAGIRSFARWIGVAIIIKNTSCIGLAILLMLDSFHNNFAINILAFI